MELIDVKKFILKNLFSIIFLTIGLSSFVGAVIYVYINKCEECPICNSLTDLKEDVKEEKKQIINTFKIDVKGAVKKPGVYEVTSNSTVNDAINLAGGLNSNGVTTNINLSKKLTEEMVVYIFNKTELKNKETQNKIVCEVPKCECEEVVVTKEICATPTEPIVTKEEDQKSLINNSKNEQETISKDNKISINTDSIEELMTLSGIGESKAKQIIEYRRINGNFTKIEDIKNVSGIGEKAYEKIKDNIKI